MKTETPNLWPTDVRLDVQSPLGILEAQAALLGQITHGLLQAAVETETAEGWTEHRLVVAPGRDEYRHVLLVARHAVHLPYPAAVVHDSLAIRVQRESFSIHPVYDTVYPSASSDDELIEHLRRALNSEAARAVLLSLIAKGNQPRQARAG
jgi:hypothetical protein